MGYSYKNRVVVTGLGIVAPNGIGIDAFWESLIAGRSGIRRISRFDVTGWRSQIAGEVQDFDPRRWIPAECKPQRRARHTQFAMAATAMAMEDAKLQRADLELPHPLPIAMGVGTTSYEIVADSATAIAKSGPKHASPTVITEATPNSVAGGIADFLNVPVSVHTFASACVAGLDAIAAGADIIRRGESDLVLAGGADAPISPVPLANFDVGGMASRANEAPERASRPFDLRRDSGVISEGGAVLILENLESARARGVQPYLELLGTGVHTDKRGLSCSGWEFTMRTALAEASLLYSDIDYISAWGPGHPEIDRIETDMIKRVFGAHAYHMAVSSIKGVTGNALAAAGPLMLASCCLAFKHNLIPPTANYEEPDPACDLDYAGGDLELSFARLEGMGAVIECGSEEQAQKLSDAYVELCERGESAIVVSQTRTEVQVINEKIRERLRERKKLMGDEVEVTSLERVDLTQAQMRDPTHYPPGGVLVFNQDYRGIRRGQQGGLVGITASGIALQIEGRVHRLPLSQIGRLTVCRARSIPLCTGDKLQLKANGAALDTRKLANGEVVTIASVDPSGTIILADGRALPSDYRQFQRGYAVTSYGSQGKTVDHVLFSDSGARAASNMQQWYVTISRGRKSIQIYTGDKEQLRRVVSRSGERQLALDLGSPPLRSRRRVLNQVLRGLKRGREFARRVALLASRARAVSLRAAGSTKHYETPIRNRQTNRNDRTNVLAP